VIVHHSVGLNQPGRRVVQASIFCAGPKAGTFQQRRSIQCKTMDNSVITLALICLSHTYFISVRDVPDSNF